MSTINTVDIPSQTRSVDLGEVAQAGGTRRRTRDGDGVGKMEAQVRHSQDDGQSICGWSACGGR